MKRPAKSQVEPEPVPNEHLSDDWRFRRCQEWQLEQLASYNPEDEWISQLDGEVEEVSDKFKALNIINRHLDPRTARIVRMHLLDDISFRELARLTGGHASNIFAVYHRGLAKLRPHLERFIRRTD